MVKVRTARKEGVAVRFVGGRLSVIHDGMTEIISLEPAPHGDSEIMRTLEAILDQY